MAGPARFIDLSGGRRPRAVAAPSPVMAPTSKLCAPASPGLTAQQPWQQVSAKPSGGTPGAGAYKAAPSGASSTTFEALQKAKAITGYRKVFEPMLPGARVSPPPAIRRELSGCSLGAVGQPRAPSPPAIRKELSSGYLFAASAQPAVRREVTAGYPLAAEQGRSCSPPAVRREVSSGYSSELASQYPFVTEQQSPPSPMRTDNLSGYQSAAVQRCPPSPIRKELSSRQRSSPLLQTRSPPQRRRNPSDNHSPAPPGQRVPGVPRAIPVTDRCRARTNPRDRSVSPMPSPEPPGKPFFWLNDYKQPPTTSGGRGIQATTSVGAGLVPTCKIDSDTTSPIDSSPAPSHGKQQMPSSGSSSWQLGCQWPSPSASSYMPLAWAGPPATPQAGTRSLPITNQWVSPSPTGSVTLPPGNPWISPTSSGSASLPLGSAWFQASPSASLPIAAGWVTHNVSAQSLAAVNQSAPPCEPLSARTDDDEAEYMDSPAAANLLTKRLKDAMEEYAQNDSPAPSRSQSATIPVALSRGVQSRSQPPDIQVDLPVEKRRASDPTLSAGASSLYRKAMFKRAKTEDSMHPQRAHVAGEVLKVANAVLSKEGLPIDSGSDVVKKLFLDSIPERLVEIESIEQLIHPDLLRRFLKVLASGPGNSVEATFHGARSEHIDGIIKTGLSPDLCVIGANGNGAYVGCHAGVAHQYASLDPTGLRHMCLVLVVVGRGAVKGVAGEKPIATAMDRLKNPTQYCFVDEERLLASHVIKYRVVSDGCRRTGGGWDDPFARKLNSAIMRAGKRERKGGKR